MPRDVTPLHFGEGLDKENGVMVVRPTSFSDLRNVLLHEGRLILRPGYAAAGTGAFPEVDQLLTGWPLKSEGLGIAVGYSSTAEEVHIYRVAPDLSLVEHIGEWEHDLTGGWGSSTPRVIMCEVFGRIFMAHDEPLVSRRAPTLYYDPITGSSLLNVLTADFAGTAAGESESVTPDAVRFRGVVRHLSYLVGWGFGTAAEPRPELVRISLPGEPTTFDPNHYFVAGDRRDPVLACGPSGTEGEGTILNVWKRTETHGIFGTDRRSFGIRETDPRYGIVASRPWLNIEGVAIAWSEEGPRAWTGLGPSSALDIALDLDGWEPGDLVDEGAATDAFALYVPRERVGLFVFGRRVYALTSRIPGRWRWSYQELGFTPHGAMTLFAATEPLEAPTGFPEYVPPEEPA